VRGVVRTEAPALVAECLVGRVGRRHWHRKLRERLRLFHVADVDHPQRLVGLVAVGIERLGIRDDEAAVEPHNVDGVERDGAGLHQRIVAANELGIFDVREIMDHHTQCAIGAKSIFAAVLELLRYIHGTVQSGERFLVAVFAPFLVFLDLALALAGQPPAGDELRLGRVRHVDDLNSV